MSAQQENRSVQVAQSRTGKDTSYNNGLQEIDKLDGKLDNKIDLAKIDTKTILSKLSDLKDLKGPASTMVVQLALQKLGYDCGKIDGYSAKSPEQAKELKDLVKELNSKSPKERESELSKYLKENGSKTQKALFKFQEDAKITKDGIAGNSTRLALKLQIALKRQAEKETVALPSKQNDKQGQTTRAITQPPAQEQKTEAILPGKPVKEVPIIHGNMPAPGTKEEVIEEQPFALKKVPQKEASQQKLQPNGEGLFNDICGKFEGTDFKDPKRTGSIFTVKDDKIVAQKYDKKTQKLGEVVICEEKDVKKYGFENLKQAAKDLNNQAITTKFSQELIGEDFVESVLGDIKKRGHLSGAQQSDLIDGAKKIISSFEGKEDYRLARGHKKFGIIGERIPGNAHIAKTTDENGNTIAKEITWDIVKTGDGRPQSAMEISLDMQTGHYAVTTKSEDPKIIADARDISKKLNSQ